MTIAPGARTLVPTGIAIELPPGTEAQVRPRSGLALKHGLSVLNTPGTVDEGYRGEVGVILINHGAARSISSSSPLQPSPEPRRERPRQLSAFRYESTGADEQT